MSWRVMLNKYDKAVIELVSEDAIIYELIQEKINSTRGQIIDFILEGVLAFVVALKDLKKRDAYYLVIYEKKTELVHIQRNLNISHKDVTSAVQAAAEKRSFEFGEQRYKLYRKIK